MYSILSSVSQSVRLSVSALALVGAAAAPAWAQTAPAPTPAAISVAPAPLSSLVASVNIPYQRFVLKNGLTVLVHTDRKAPIIGVTTYFRVGSKHEPRGRTGFAHLYEHLFFGGSANVPDFDVPLEAVGASTNGSTWYDRTNYVETVPSGALELALFLESDRMGHLLPAVTQDKLDKQRGVVQNEKRQGDNQTFGLLQYVIGDGLFPVGHPYRHSTIGSMADLDAASLTDVRRWFTDHYAPNNAILVLSGDVDAATARPLVEKYFGAIRSGPVVRSVQAGPVTLPAPIRREMTDRVANTRLLRVWSGPGLNDRDAVALSVGMDVLGGLASSRLDNALVRGKEMAISVSAEAEAHEQVSVLQVSMDIRPGVDRAQAEAALDAVIATFLRDGPTPDEVRRSATRTLSHEIDALEVVGGFGGKGTTLAEGLLYSRNPAHYKAELTELARITPEQVRDAMRKWLGRPVLAIGVTPGERTQNGDTMGGWGDEATRPAPTPDPRKPVPPVKTGPARKAPPVAPVGRLAFPALQRATLSNGIPVVLARRTAVPKVIVHISFDAGLAADALDTPGTQGLLLAMLDEGTRAEDGVGQTRNATQVQEDQERLGASISLGTSLDTSSVTLNALAANLSPSLGLMADILRRPALSDADVARVKAQRLASLAQALKSPRSIAAMTLAPILFGPAHPYGMSGDGLGTAQSLSAITPDALRAAQKRWLRPDAARITVVGDITMDHLIPQLEAAFGHWQAPATPRSIKPIDRPAPAPVPRIVLIDRPQSPQSVILGGKVLPITGRTADMEALDLANEVLGAGFLSRLNTDIREDKGWSYGVSTGVRLALGQRSLILSAPVQTDRTGDALRAMIADMKAFPAKAKVTPVELQRVTEGNILSLPSAYETNAQVLGTIATNDLLGRPDNYVTTQPARLRAVTAAKLDAMAAQHLQPDGMVFVIVGDRAKVEPQLKDAGLPVEIATPPGQ
ncbi:insulinase family protein [Novosphingobium sp. FSY-8]|uniref:Insulinase family protein n=1 Tax=Novosphingobium ovatum TaxID=1908523 RepID=A0ABW9XE12_9SPHN|nr:pitrilysin family protein [Novosphingobium ovatum]NBC36789.1 insulinase family protein [Novosphingobium ovatum]